MKAMLGYVLVTAMLLTVSWTPTVAAGGADAWEADDATLVAQQPPTQRPAPAAPGERLRRALGLSDDQARRVEQILAAHRTRTAQLRIDLARAHLDAREALLAASPDRARLDAVARRVGELQGQLAAARYGLWVELRAVLTPEQWARLQGMRLRGFGAGPMRGRGRR